MPLTRAFSVDQTGSEGGASFCCLDNDKIDQSGTTMSHGIDCLE